VGTNYEPHKKLVIAKVSPSGKQGTSLARTCSHSSFIWWKWCF